MQSRLFADIKIVEFTNFGVGPRTASYLVSYGAESVKIESTTRPDGIRNIHPFKKSKTGQNHGQMYTKINSNKYGLSLNLNHPKALELAKKLIASWANLVIDNFTPGTLHKWGLDCENLQKLKPDLIMLSTCMQGQTGAASKHPGFGTELSSLVGFNYIAGWPDRLPAGVFGPYTDLIAPAFNVVAILAAIDHRRVTGMGQYLDASQYEPSLYFLSPLLLDYAVNGRIAERNGNNSDYAAPHGVYRCPGEDRWIAIAITTDEQWQKFCSVIGNPDWSRDPAFATLLGRKKNHEQLDQWIEEWTKQHPAEEIMKILQSAGVPAGVVASGKDLWNDPQLKHDIRFHEISHPDTGTCFADRSPIKLSAVPQVEQKHAPAVGEHTEFVCREILHLSEEEFSRLAAEGVFS